MPAHKPDSDLTSLKGVGKKTARSLEKAGFQSTRDLLWHLPRAYQDRGNPVPIRSLTPGGTFTVKGQVMSIRERRYRTRRTLELLLTDSTGILVLKWFRFNRWFKESLEKRFQPGHTLTGTGRVDIFAGNLEMHHPELVQEDEEENRTLVPIYPLMEGLSQKLMRRIVDQAVNRHLDELDDPIPGGIRKKYGLCDLRSAITGLHDPGSGADVGRLNSGSTPWHWRLKFEELLWFQLGILSRRRAFEAARGIRVTGKGRLGRDLLASLPYDLTNAQKRALAEIIDDMGRDRPMHRLLQGDVGSGKTLVAFMAMLQASEAGHQSILMAPTEVLAEQHYRNMNEWGRAAGINVVLLTGTTPPPRKKEILASLSRGKAMMAVGTHALIQEGVNLDSLALAVVDEQHRFGVMQRLALKEKGVCPHFLVMTATPIPRSLSLVLYGDLDISILDEMPPGRLAVATEIYPQSSRARLHLDVAREVAAGRQAFIVYPLVEESEKAELLAASEMAEHYRKKIFPHLSVGLLTGRMPSAEKEKVMEEFRQGAIQVLVATTVIEVGVDVPNATLMIIEHAERFGLFQLHQLRGRVGRGQHPSRCILVPSTRVTAEARERLEVIRKTSSGFEIAEHDLRMRGPGDFLGTRQAGLPDFRYAHPVKDHELVSMTREAAELLYPSGGKMREDLKREVAKFWREGYALATSG